MSDSSATILTATRIEFPNRSGQILSGRLDQPVGSPIAWAVFAHCFTCTKNLRAIGHLAGSLVVTGIAVSRFDFTGLGASEGEFAETTFSHNVEDLVAAAKQMDRVYGTPRLLIGHSLGGTAALHAAARLPVIRAVATLGSPAHASHIARLLRTSLPEIEASGEAQVNLGGRTFTTRCEFLRDLEQHTTLDIVRDLRLALLVPHSPLDAMVEIENAADIFCAARHPKSFISLDCSDHLLTAEADAADAGSVLAAWARKYVTTSD